MSKKNFIFYRLIFVLALSFFCISAWGEGVWQLWRPPVPNYHSHFHDVHFVDVQHGWVVGREVIGKTDDGGDTWTLRYLENNDTLYDVQFTNLNRGYAVGYRAASDEEGIILRTDDGGENWSETKVGLALTGLYFISDTKGLPPDFTGTKGWVVGIDEGEQGIILHTEDGGKNWSVQYKGGNEIIQRIFFINEKEGWCVAHPRGVEKPKAVVLHTQDGGQNWEQLSVIEDAYYLVFYFLDSRRGWAAGARRIGDEKPWKAQAILLFTEDGGKTWAERKIEIPSNWWDAVHFVDPQNGWLIGSYDTENDTEGLILRTSDGGATWQPELRRVKKKYSVIFSGACFLDINHGWVIGWNGLILRTADGGRTWMESQKDNTLSGEYLRKVRFYSSKSGWIVGDDGIVFHTEDGGETWQRQKGPTNDDLHDLHFVTADKGWIVGDSGAIWHTTNGGATWHTQDSGTSDELNAVWFADEKEGWIGGYLVDPIKGEGYLLHTIDGGAHWERQIAMKNIQLRLRLNDIQFLDKENGWAVGNAGLVLHTENGGKKWEAQFMDAKIEFGAVYFLNHRLGWIAGANGIILHTEDGGKTWETQNTGTGYLRDIYFANPLEGWCAAGMYIMHTTDGGKHWSEQETPGGERGTTSICYGGDKRLWTVGPNSTIMKYFDPNLSVIQPEGWSVELSGKQLTSWGAIKRDLLKLLPNYPNPFNAETWIPYYLSKDMPVTIQIYNARGQLVRKLELGQKPTGEYFTKETAARWDGRNEFGEAVASGLYFYHLSAGEFTTTRRMFMVK